MAPLQQGIMDVADPLRFGTLGVARITPGGLTGPAADNSDVVVAAVAARDRSRAETFAEQHGIESVYDSYDGVILDAFVDAVRNGTPMPTDAEDAIKQMRVIDAAYRAAGMPTR